MQLEIDPKTFLDALLGSDLETAHVLVLDAYRAATKALLADRDRYFSVLHAIDPETFGTVTGRTKTEFKPVYHTAPLEPTGRTSTEQQLANNPPSVPPEHAASTKPTPETWHQVRSIRQARMFVGQTVAVSYEPPNPHDDGDTHVHTYVADIVDQGGGTWSLVDSLDNVLASGGPSDQTATVYLRPWGKGYGWTDVDVWGMSSRDRGPLRACRFDVSLDDYDEGMEMPVQVGLTHGWAARECVYTDLETALEATRAADETEDPADGADDGSEWKGWARLYTTDDAREWIGRKAHVSVGPPDLDDLGPVYEIADVKPFPENGKDGWKLMTPNGYLINYGAPTDEEPYVLHLLEVADEPTEDAPCDKPKPGMWHKVTTREEAERFVGMRVEGFYRRHDKTSAFRDPYSPFSRPVARVVACSSHVWRMLDSKGETVCLGCKPDEPLSTLVWAFE